MKAPAPRAPTPNPLAAKTEEANARLQDARRQKDAVEQDLKEAIYFTRPRMQRTVRSDNPPDASTVGADAVELLTGVAIEANEDFATEITNGFFPRGQKWAKSKKAAIVPPEVWAEVEKAAAEADDQVFNEINDSNLYETLGSALVPDIGIGTVALMVEESGASHEPIRCQHVPLRELDINVGPYGDVDDRFATRYVRYAKLFSLVPKSIVPAAVKKKMTGPEKNKLARVTWGFWRDWSEPRDHVWTSVVMIDGEVVHYEDLKGDGCCPLIVMRFAPDAIHAFGNGPTIDALPDLRVVDQMTEAQQDRAMTSMRPPFTFPDDGILSFEGGIQSGMAYPKRPGGTQHDIQPLYFQGDVQLGILTLDDLIKRIRRRHYADYPDQEGKTPPTATQWLDEMVMAQRRIGTPGQRFWGEGPGQIFRRFVYLGHKRGTVKKLTSGKSAVSTQPSNPATQAQEQQEVLTGIRVLEVIKQFFPELAKAVIDEYKTAENIQKKLGDTIVVLRTQEDAKKIVEQLLQVPAVQNAMTGADPNAAPAPAQPGAPA